MNRDWRPGDVLTVGGTGAMLVIKPGLGEGLMFTNDYGHQHPIADLNAAARPLAVIDPEHREQVERLTETFYRVRGLGEPCLASSRIDNMQAALREFANPPPPKPEEPTGLGAVVEDAHGKQYVRTTNGAAPWLSCGLIQFDRWSDVPAVRVLSEGVPA